MEASISTAEAAKRLATTAPTVRRMLESGQLAGNRRSRGSRFVWDVTPTSVNAYLAAHGPINGKRPSRPSKLDNLAAELEELREQVRQGAGGNSLVPASHSERDELRAENVSLRDALARTREALEMQLQADEERSAQVDHLLDAAKAGERADTLHRRAFAEIEGAITAFTQPGHLGQMGSGQR